MGFKSVDPEYFERNLRSDIDCMDSQSFFRKLNTAIGLATRGKLLRNVMRGETEWQRDRRKKKWKQRLITGKPFRDRLSSGGVIELYPHDRVSELIYKRQFEVDEQEFIRQYLRAGDIFVDVGANLGLFTIIAARIVGKQGQVFSFEPVTSHYRRLLRNVSLNRLTNVNCVKAGLSDKEETRKLTISLGEYSAWSTFARPAVGNNFDFEMVSCITWDSFAIEHEVLGKVSLIKLDVEGWELFVLNGATQTLSRPDSPDLLVEFVDENSLNAGLSCDRLYERLEKFGYRMYRVDMNKRVLIPEKLRERYSYVNLLATKREKFVLKRLKIALA